MSRRRAPGQRDGRRPRNRLLRAVLRPAQGRSLPRELRAGRVGRIAGAIPEGVASPRFAHLLQRIDASPIFGGNRVRVFFHGEHAFAAMREAIRGAREELLLESYILRGDRTGMAFLGELAAAVERGVTVRVLADALGSHTTRAAFWREAAERGVAVRFFHPLLTVPWAHFFRNHRKLLVADRRQGFTGGMNIGEEYGRPGGTPLGSWRDTQVCVEGAAAWEMALIFAEGWVHAGGDPLEISPLRMPEDGGPGARVLALDSRPGRGNLEAAAVLAAIAAAARRTLWITNSYFAPGRRAARIVAEAARRGVDVRLLLQGTTDAPVVRHAGHGYFDELLAHGVRIFEYLGPVLHAKSLVADGQVSVIGSSNLDFRSFLFNAEANLVIFDPATGGEMEQGFQQDLALSNEILAEHWRRRSLRHRALDRLARLLSPVL